MLAVVINEPVLQQRLGDERAGGLALPGATCGKRGALSGVMIVSTPGHGLRVAEIEADDLAARDRALHQHGMGQIVDVELGGITGSAGYFEPSVAPVDRLSDNLTGVIDKPVSRGIAILLTR